MQYDAFISYRHHPNDIRVAETIHRLLERFHEPGPIRKKYGKIHRIFRDKDELPITSDLTATITQALENSEYLIVICSEHTRDSLWIQREIEVFLQTHSQDKVLTVLASGEPQDTIPEQLLFQNVTNPETGEVTRKAVEPLSCDWRVDKRKAKQIELPRLAAAILGCGYDELRQRQRQYRTQRMILGFTSALAVLSLITAYVAYTAVEINRANNRIAITNRQLEHTNQELENANQQVQQANRNLEKTNRDLEEANGQVQANLDQALLNQSQYLTASALEELTAGDRLTAMALAVAALPGEDQPRPYYAPAEQVLFRSLGLYSPQKQITAVGAITTDVNIKDFCATEDGEYLWVLTDDGNISIWDTHSYQRFSGISHHPDVPGGAPEDIALITQDELLLIRYRDSIVIWEYLVTGGFWDRIAELECDDWAQLSDGTLVLLRIESDGTYIDYADPYDGSISQSLLLPIPEGLRIRGFCGELFPEDRPILLNFSSDQSPYHTYAFDGQSLQSLLEAEYGPWEAAFDSRGNVLMMVSDGTGMYNGSVGEFEIFSPAGVQIHCIDPKTGHSLWQYDFQSYSYSNCRTLAVIPGREQIICQYANDFLVLNPDGTLANYGRASDIPVYTSVQENLLLGILQNGSIFQYKYGDTVASLDVLQDGITQAQITPTYFVSTGTNKVIVYRLLSDTPDAVLEAEFGGTIPDSLILDERFFTLTYTALSCYDLSSNACLWTAETGSNCKLLGAGEDKTCVYLLQNRDKLITVDIATGEQTQLTLPSDLDGQRGSFYAPPVFHDQRLYYLLTRYDGQVYAASYDPETGEYTLYAETPLEEACKPVILGARGQEIWIGYTDADTLETLYISGGDLTEFADCWEFRPVWMEAGEESYLLLDDDIIRISDKETLAFGFEFDIGSYNVVTVGLPYKDGFVCLTTEGRLYYVDAEAERAVDLTLSDLVLSYLRQGTADVRWYETAAGELAVCVNRTMTVIDPQTWQVRMSFSNCLGYSLETDQFMILESGQLCRYDHLTTEELLAEANSWLQNYALSTEQKKAYGLG